MSAEPLVPVTVVLPASVLDEIAAILNAASPFPSRLSRAAAVKGAVGSFLVNARATSSASVASATPAARPRFRSTAIAPRAAAR